MSAFLAAIRRMPDVTAAAEAAGIKRTQHYERYRLDMAYRKAFDDAWDLGIQSIEDVVIERVMEGVREEVIFKGRRCYERDEHGDIVYECDDQGELVCDDNGKPKPVPLMVQRHSVERERLILRALRPEKYKDSHELSGPGGKPLLEKLEVVYVRAKPEGES